jgi:integrase
MVEIDKLTPLTCKRAKPGKHFDGRGLYLEVTDTGSRYWRMKYRHAGRENRLAFGVFPEVSLAEARQRRDEARALLRDGTDPAEHRRSLKDAAVRERLGTFGAVAAEWFTRRSASWAPATAKKARFVLDKYLLPKLRSEKVRTLSTPKVVPVIEGIAATAPNIAVKARQHVHGVLGEAVRLGLRPDGMKLDLSGTVSLKKGNIAAATDPAKIAGVVKAVMGYESPVTRAALLLMMFTASRPGVVAAAEWSEFNLDRGEWLVPGSKMKTGLDHLSPLSSQAAEAVRSMLRFTEGKQYVFPALARQKTPHLHRDALSKALRTAGLQGTHAAHGFRAMFRTAGAERLEIPVDVLEAQLAHGKKGDVQKAYNRGTLLQARCEAMQRWADWLEGLAAERRKAA